MINHNNKKNRLEAEKHALLESEFSSVRKRLRDVLLKEDAYTPILLEEIISINVNTEEVKKILEELVKEYRINGWYISDKQYLTKSSLFNMIQYDGSEALRESEIFDLIKFSKRVGVNIDIVRNTVSELLEGGKLIGHLTEDDKLVTDDYIQDKLKREIK